MAPPILPRSRTSRTRPSIGGSSGPAPSEDTISSQSSSAPKARLTLKNASKKARIKKKGSAANFADIPVDILYEILSYVDPMDVINMTRTCKGTRSSLTSRMSRLVWRNAIWNAGMPECPQDLNEVQYIRFALDPYCDFCGSMSRRQYLRYIYRSREKVCVGCVTSHFEECEESYWFYIPTVTMVEKLGKGVSTKTFGHSKTIKGYKQLYDAFAGNNRARIRWENDLKKETLDLFKIPSKRGSKNVMMLPLWRRNIRRARFDAILAKLKAEGWADEVAILEKDNWGSYYITTLKKIKGVNNVAKLTQQAWEKMKPELVTVMRRIRQSEADRVEYRLEQEKKEEQERPVKIRLPLYLKAFAEYEVTHPYNPYGPRAADLAEFPEIQSLIFQPLEEEVEQATFEKVLNESFDELSLRWRTFAEERLLEIMRAKIPEATKKDLWSPAATFSCPHWLCQKQLLTSTALIHSHCEASGKTIYGRELPHAPWKGSYLAFDQVTWIKMKAVLDTHPPLPIGEPMHLDLYECEECSRDNGRRVLMTWFEVVMDSSSCFLIQNHSLRSASLTNEEQKYKNIYVDLKLASSEQDIICSICRVSYSTNSRWCGSYFVTHQEKCHGKKEISWREGRDFYRIPTVKPYLAFRKDFVLDATLDNQAMMLKIIQTCKDDHGYANSPIFHTNELFARQHYNCRGPAQPQVGHN